MENIKWNNPGTVPNVEKGKEELFWIAVESPHSSSPHVFLAYYQNRPLEFDDEDEEYPLGDVLYNTEGEAIESIGWMDCKQHYDFDDYYSPIEFNDQYKLLGWAEYTPPKFTGKQ